jgi:hypothetical protein
MSPSNCLGPRPPKKGYFFVGGKYFDTPNGKVMAGHAYVEYLIPQNRTHRFPLVMMRAVP